MNHFVDSSDAPPPATEHPVMPTLTHPAPKHRRAGLAATIRGARKRAHKSHAPTTAPAPAPTSSSASSQWASARAPLTPHRHRGGSDVTKLVMLVAVLLVGLGGAAMAAGVLQFGTPDDIGIGAEGGSASSSLTGDTWSYYHDRNYETDTTGPKWNTDRTRSTDPNEAVLGDTSRWEYDGAYKYGAYGQNGMRQRSAGRETADPLYSNTDPLPDVFAEYGGSLDPAGDQAVGAPPANFTNPYFDPYAGYANPYANRLRLAYGEGYDRGTTPVP